MPSTVTMPQLGETVTEGTILRWAKQVGETIAVDEVLVEISTDKVDTEVPSPVGGIIAEILVPEGRTVPVGTPLAVIAESAAASVAPPSSSRPAPSTVAPPPPPPAPLAEPSPPPPTTPPSEPLPAPAVAAVEARGMAAAETPIETQARLLSPVVRKLAREHDLDLAGIPGTGDGGRITRKDVEGYLATRPTAATPPPTVPATPPLVAVSTAPPTFPPTTPAPPAPTTTPMAAPPGPRAAVPADEEVVALDRLRVRIGENMIKAKQTAAHVWTSVEVDYERVERVRSTHKDAFKQQEGFSLSYLPFIARATIDALGAFPVANSSYYLADRKAVFHKAVHLGIAIDLNQKGLIVATIRNADALRLVGLARRIRELADKARAGKLEPDDISGSTFTITNPGPFGSFMSAPIINVPNTGILSTDAVAKRPAVITTDDGQDTIAIRHIGYLGLSWDHRAFDGSTAVLFVQRIKQNLETWDWAQELS